MIDTYDTEILNKWLSWAKTLGTDKIKIVAGPQPNTYLVTICDEKPAHIMTEREQCISCGNSPDVLISVQHLGHPIETFCLQCLVARSYAVAQVLVDYLVHFKAVKPSTF